MTGIAVERELIDQIAQSARLSRQCRCRCRGLLDHRGILLSGLVHMIDGCIDLGKSRGLLARRCR